MIYSTNSYHSTHTTNNPTIPQTATAHPFQTRSSLAAPGAGVVVGTEPLPLPLPVPVPVDEFDPPEPAAPVGTPVNATDEAADLYAAMVRSPDAGGLMTPAIPP